MLTFQEVIRKLKELKEKGYVKTHRTGSTGIGKTLEDLLGIQENNIPSSDFNEEIELKTARKISSSMLTLFTKAPLPRNANSHLLETFGYITEESQGRKILHSTVNGVDYNTLRGVPGFKINVISDKLILSTYQHMDIVPYWDREILRKCFESKLPKLVYVKAESKGSNEDEEFWYNEAYLLSGFNFDNFIRLIKEGNVLVDIRIGQYPNGKPHDHGTGFRVHPNKLDLCFKERIDLMR